jgi:hypothetical protein
MDFDNDDISEMYDNDGIKINPDLIPKPAMCLTCKRDDDPREVNLCILNRLDQQDEEEFECGVFEPR